MRHKISLHDFLHRGKMRTNFFLPIGVGKGGGGGGGGAGGAMPPSHIFTHSVLNLSNFKNSYISNS